MHNTVLWIAAGLIPYIIKRQKGKDGQLLTVKAFLWQLTVQWKKGDCSWNLSLPFIEHIRP